jgi:peptidyl-prolyl cis-trans isomerase A (cyclophilin A)
MRNRAVFIVALIALAALPLGSSSARAKGGNPVVVLNTSEGVIKVELFSQKAPISVENFLAYVDTKHYDGTIFHRVMDGFMIQGGGFEEDMSQKETREPIVNEADNGLKNEVGTLAMARTAVRDSATSQFFINLKDNTFLDHGSRDFGYAVFGKVIEGMDVVNKIAKASTGKRGGQGDVPTVPILIESARRE